MAESGRPKAQSPKNGPGDQAPVTLKRGKRRLSETLIIVVSIFGLIGVGYLATRIGLLSTAVGDRLAEFVFTLAIPCLLFETLATADLHGVSPWRIWAAYFAPFALVWALSHLMIRRVFGRDQPAGLGRARPPIRTGAMAFLMQATPATKHCVPDRHRRRHCDHDAVSVLLSE